MAGIIQQSVGYVNNRTLDDLATKCWQVRHMTRDPSFTYQRAFGKRLRACRIAAGYTNHGDFALLIGLTPEGYRLYEVGARQPKFHVLAQISERLGKSLDFLVLGKNDPEE